MHQEFSQLEWIWTMAGSSRYFFAMTLGISVRHDEHTWRHTVYRCEGSVFWKKISIQSSRGSEGTYTLLLRLDRGSRWRAGVIVSKSLSLEDGCEWDSKSVLLLSASACARGSVYDCCCCCCLGRTAPHVVQRQSTSRAPCGVTVIPWIPSHYR
jgi:hypothetical protein